VARLTGAFASAAPLILLCLEADAEAPPREELGAFIDEPQPPLAEVSCCGHHGLCLCLLVVSARPGGFQGLVWWPCLPVVYGTQSLALESLVVSHDCLRCLLYHAGEGILELC